MTKSLVLFAVATLLCTPAHSQDQNEMNQTADKDFQKADAQLNVTYKKLLGKLDADGKKKLIASERAWVAYRDAESDFEADAAARGGSMEPMIYSGASKELTDARIKQLEKIMADDE